MPLASWTWTSDVSRMKFVLQRPALARWQLELLGLDKEVVYLDVRRIADAGTWRLAYQ